MKAQEAREIQKKSNDILREDVIGTILLSIKEEVNRPCSNTYKTFEFGITKKEEKYLKSLGYTILANSTNVRTTISWT